MTKRNIWISPFLLIGMLLMLTNSCKKDDNNNPTVKTPVLTTTTVSNITQTAASSGGKITSDGGETVMVSGVCWSTSPNPTIGDSKTEDGTGTGSFTSTIIGLIPNTTYYVRAYGINGAGTGYGSALSFTTQKGSTFTDSRDGNVYKIVTIGSQVWMGENLKYLPSVVGPDVGSETTANYYVDDYDGKNVTEAKATANYTTYGVLYNWAAVMAGSVSSSANPSGVQGACPVGWHVPSDAEWKKLTDYLGGEGIAGNKLKETGTTHWSSTNTGVTNESGFTALPGGYRGTNGSFFYLGNFGYWWSATEYNAAEAWYRYVNFEHSNLYSEYHPLGKQLGFSVRCVKD